MALQLIGKTYLEGQVPRGAPCRPVQNKPVNAREPAGRCEDTGPPPKCGAGAEDARLRAPAAGGRAAPLAWGRPWGCLGPRRTPGAGKGMGEGGEGREGSEEGG